MRTAEVVQCFEQLFSMSHDVFSLVAIDINTFFLWLTGLKPKWWSQRTAVRSDISLGKKGEVTGHKKAVVYPVAECLCRHVRPAFHKGIFSDPLGRLEVQRLIMVHTVRTCLA